jgi:hypothetical protein
MVITQALYDEGIKYSSNIDGIFGEIIPSPGIISASRVGVKDRRTHPGVENGVYSPILHPYEPNPSHPPNPPKPPPWKCYFDDVVYSLSTSFRNPDGDYTSIV